LHTSSIFNSQQDVLFYFTRLFKPVLTPLCAWVVLDLGN
jgi:hypothetical protein